ncbi:MAG TPA: biotin/lipoyl-binding protein, partial [Gemmataceae bacterium]|nr:biotin/lipoyl-binding protein [Gemmataceae bacterium]
MRRRMPLLLLTLGLAAIGCSPRTTGAPKDAGPPKVTVAPPLVQSVTEFTDLTGTLAAVKTADVRPRVSGYIQAVLFEEGAEVAADQPLVQIDTQPFDATV